MGVTEWNLAQYNRKGAERQRTKSQQNPGATVESDGDLSPSPQAPAGTEMIEWVKLEIAIVGSPLQIHVTDIVDPEDFKFL